MKLSILLFSISAPLVTSQCLVNNPSEANLTPRHECTYDKVLTLVNRKRNALRNAGDTTCLRRDGELAALLGFDPNNFSENQMRAKVESICDQAISRSRTDGDYAIDFNSIQLIDSADSTTINRFLKEFFDGGKISYVTCVSADMILDFSFRCI